LSQPRKAYEELIVNHGGALASSVTASVNFLVSSEDDVKACPQKVAAARGREVPIVQEGFVDACVAEKKMLDAKFFLVKGAAIPPKKRRPSVAKGAAKAAAKRAKVETGVVRTSDAMPVIAKAGLADKAAVVVEEVSRSFGKASVTWDVELVLNDPTTGKDKFYNMQLLASKEKDAFWAVQHWGRTGMDGRVHVDGAYPDIGTAKQVFKRKYRQKTGNAWGQIDGTFVEAPGKYKLLAREAKAEVPGTWQYYMHNSVDGKKIGWYDYQEEPAKNMEKYWRQYNSNEGLGVRFVHSDYFKYEVNFTDMIQTNTKSGTRRVIRRVPAGEKPSPAAPHKIPEPAEPAKPAAAPEADSSEDEDADGEEDEGEGETEAEAEAEAEAEDAGEAEGAGEAAGAAAEAAPPGGSREAPAAPAGSRGPPPDDAVTEAGSPAEADETETLPFGLPVDEKKRRAP